MEWRVIEPRRASGRLRRGYASEGFLSAGLLNFEPRFCRWSVFGFGIGATVAVGVLAEAVLLRPLPYPHASRLVVVGHAEPTAGGIDGAEAKLAGHRNRSPIRNAGALSR